jgi:hypothetical protein
MEGKKMIKILEQKLFITTIFAVLLICGSCAFLVPNVNAEVTSNVQEQTNSILGSLLGVNPNSYSTKINSQTSSQDTGLSQNRIDFTLNSNQSSVRVKASFVNSTLNLLYLSGYSGTLANAQPDSNTGNMAKDFLGRYRAYTGDSFYGTLVSMLNGVTGSTNVTESNGNVSLKVLNSNGATVDYVWTYIDSNGIAAQSKNVVLSYYQGQLNCFINNWPLYTVVGTPIISRQQAIEAALDVTNNYTYEINNGNATSIESVAGFQVASESLNEATLSYVNFPNVTLARDSDPFNLYPSWWVPVGFNKFYPGDVSGIAVTVWADTGQVSSTELMYADSGFGAALQNLASTSAQTMATQPADQNIVKTANQNSITLIAPATLIIAFSAGILVANKKRIKLSGGKKLFHPTLWAVILCSTIILGTATSIARADSVFPNSSARIYGSLEGGKDSPAQTDQEKNAAYWVQGQLHNDFAASGYTTFNNVGGDTTAENIKGNASSDAATYDHCTVFQYGHMDGPDAYVDNTGNVINYTDISYYVTNTKYKLVLLWVCCQAQTGSVSISHMCDAWMNNGVTSPDGYNNSDNSGQCFISFYGFSPWIGNDTDTFYGQITPSMKYFIQDFYYNALVNGYDIRNSLNQASISIFNTTYTSSILYQGYNLWWPGDPRMEGYGGDKRSLALNGWYPMDFYYDHPLSSMQVYGDSSVYLFQPRITLSANHGLSPTFYINGEAHSTGDVHVTPGSYWVNLGSTPSGYSFHNLASSYMGPQYNLPVYCDIYSDGTVTANYYYTTPTAPSTPDVSGPIPSQTVYAGYEYQFCASSTDPNELETIAYTFYWGDGTNTTVGGYSSGDTAYASHTWSSTGEYYVTVVAQDSYGLYSDTSDPVSVNVEELIPTYNLNLDAYDDTWTQINVGVYIDNNWVGTTPCVAYLHAGTYYVSFDNSFYEWWGDYEYLVSGSGYVPISSDTGVTAYYAVQGK